jgi:hypothetical protein
MENAFSNPVTLIALAIFIAIRLLAARRKQQQKTAAKKTQVEKSIQEQKEPVPRAKVETRSGDIFSVDRRLMLDEEDDDDIPPYLREKKPQPKKTPQFVQKKPVLVEVPAPVILEKEEPVKAEHVVLGEIAKPILKQSKWSLSFKRSELKKYFIMKEILGPPRSLEVYGE